ncbi:MAG TPA: choice-of-anchor tandem repeat GloVer-containing protein [Rhizomicrobium sp.]|jgi:uncharacterized repeat protein (TIGR03803 family)
MSQKFGMILKSALAAGMAATAISPALSATSHAPKRVKPEQVVYDFCEPLVNCGDGGGPTSGPIMDSSGNLYGTTALGGANGGGTVYKLAPDGTETTLYSFCARLPCANGDQPLASLTMDSAGNLYGTTWMGGIQNCGNEYASCGTVFKVAPDGTETALYSFCPGATCTDGAIPYGNVILDSSGNLYGTTQRGGANGEGTVFEIAADGTESVLYSFCSQANCGDGEQPQSGLYMDGSGNLFGTTPMGGAYNQGTVFEVAPNGTETVSYSFGATEGDAGGPIGGLIADAAGNLYGAAGGGAHGYGAVFMLSPTGTETLLYSFAAGNDGREPNAPLLLDSSGNLYGTTVLGGSTGCKGLGCGTVFKLTPGGTETVLYAFKNYKYGLGPNGGLAADSQGNLYGTTNYGGLNKKNIGGVVFKINSAIAPKP